MGTALDDFFAAYATIQVAGFPKPQRPTLNFLNAQVTDNPTNDSTDVLLTGGSGGGGVSAPILVTALATTVAGATHETIVTDGYSTAGDGGGGVFVWNSTDTRASDGGTIIAVTGVATGRWNRVFQGYTFDVRWFGGKPDGVTDNTAAILKTTQAAFAQFTRNPLPPAAFPGLSPVNIYLAAGAWVVSGSPGQAGIELPQMMGIIGDPHGTMILPSANTVHGVRIASYFNSIYGVSVIGGKCAIVECGPTRYPLIWNAWAGSLGTLLYEGANIIADCVFQGQSGPVFYTDTTIENRDAASSFIVTRCNGTASCWTFLNSDDATIRDSYLHVDQSGLSWQPQAVDDNGHILPAFYSMNQLKLHECELVPDGVSSLAGPTSCWVAGYGQFKMSNTRFGGENALVIMRVTSTKYKFNGVTPSSLYNAVFSQPTLDFDACAMSSVAGLNWLEIYDVFPSYIHMRDFSNSSQAPGAPRSLPLPNLILMQSRGIWIDSATCPTSKYLKVSREQNVIDLGPFATGPDFRFRTSANPADLLGAAGVTDVTQELRRYMVGAAVRGPIGGGRPTLGVPGNKWASGVIQLSQANTVAAPGLAAGVVDTETGYSIQTYHFAGSSANGVFGFDNAIPGGLASGEYTLSLGVKSAFSAQLGINLTDSTGGTNPIPLDTLDFSAGDWQRVETTFYWDGTTYAGSTSAGVSFSVGGVPASLDFTLAFFALNPGRGAQDWNYPGNVQTSNYISDEYYLPTTPVAGTYKQGDTIWNTLAIAGQPEGWRCVRGGSYGGLAGTAPQWASFGTLAFDPAQISSYNFDFDAANLTPGPITQWPSKFGLTDTQSRFTVIGTATAHASGGTGPNGAAYVSGNGSTDVLTEDLQASSTVAKELYIVAKFDTTGGASGTLWDGGVVNTGRLLRPSAGHVELVLSGIAGPFACSDTEIWAIWHVIADGTNGELDVNGVAVMPNQAYATTFLNGISMFAAAGSGDHAQASIARAIGFNATITAGQRTQMAAYLKNLYGVT